MHGVADCIIRRVIPEPTEWQNVGNQINAAFIFARSYFVFVHEFDRSHRRRRFFVLFACFLRTNIGCGLCAPLMCSILSFMIAAMCALKSSSDSTGRLMATVTCLVLLARARRRFARSADRRVAGPSKDGV